MVAGRRAEPVAPQPGIFPAEQSNQKGDQAECMVPARIPQGSGSANTLAHCGEPVLVPVGTLGCPNCRTDGNATLVAHGSEAQRAHAGSVLTIEDERVTAWLTS